MNHRAPPPVRSGHPGRLGAVIVVAAAIVHRGRLLTQQRAEPVAVAGRWELPGGRVEPGEADLDAVIRECREELGVEVLAGGRVGPDIALPGGLVLRAYTAALADPAARPRAVEHTAVRWLGAAQLADLDWLAADRVLLPDLVALLGG